MGFEGPCGGGGVCVWGRGGGEGEGLCVASHHMVEPLCLQAH